MRRERTVLPDLSTIVVSAPASMRSSIAFAWPLNAARCSCTSTRWRNQSEAREGTKGERLECQISPVCPTLGRNVEGAGEHGAAWASFLHRFWGFRKGLGGYRSLPQLVAEVDIGVSVDEHLDEAVEALWQKVVEGLDARDGDVEGRVPKLRCMDGCGSGAAISGLGFGARCTDVARGQRKEGIMEMGEKRGKWEHVKNNEIQGD